MRILKSLGGGAVMLAVLAAPAAAHEGHSHRYMGTMTSVSAEQVELKTTAGKTMTFKLDDTTRITRGTDKAAKEDLKVGMRAVIEADGGAQPATARTIKLPAAPSKTS